MNTKIIAVAFTAVFSAAMLISCKTVASGTGEKQQVQMQTDTRNGVYEGNNATATTSTKKELKEPKVVAPAIPDKKPTYGKDSAQCVLNYYLYRQSLRDWENSNDDFYFDDLLPSWHYVFTECPGYRENTFINGVKIMEYRITKLSGKEKEAAIDTMLMIYDVRMLYFDQIDFLTGEKTMVLIKYSPDKNEEIFALLEKTVKLNELKTPNHILVFYAQYAARLYEADKMELENLIDIYLSIDEIAQHNIKNNPEQQAEYNDGISRVEQIMLDYLECSIMQDVFLPKFIKDSTNVELCKKIIALMAYNKCFDQSVFQKALNQLNRLEPTPKLLLFQGRFYQNDGNFADAVKSYLKAAEGFSANESDDKFDAYIKAAEVQLILKQYQNAKSSVLKAIEVKPDNPVAILLLADIYFFGAESCGTSFVGKYAGYWAAFDKYSRAKNLSTDSSIQSKANDGMSNSRRRFPATEDIFFNGFKTGQSMTAPCWIGETVVVRASDS